MCLCLQTTVSLTFRPINSIKNFLNFGKKRKNKKKKKNKNIFSPTITKQTNWKGKLKRTEKNTRTIIYKRKNKMKGKIKNIKYLSKKIF